jgi:hypothetical protein
MSVRSCMEHGGPGADLNGSGPAAAGPNGSSSGLYGPAKRRLVNLS